MKIFNVFPTRLRNLSCISPVILQKKTLFLRVMRLHFENKPF